MGQSPSLPSCITRCTSCPIALGEFEALPDRGPLRGGRGASARAAGTAARTPARKLRLDHLEIQGSPGEEALLAHRRPREKDPGTRALVAEALRENRLCAMLEDSDIDSLVAALEYHVYDAGEFVVKEGVVGSSFFVSDDDGLEVVLRGGSVGRIPSGRAFGELALLHKRPRSVSVVAAQQGVGVWAADARLFRRVVQSSVMQQVSDNRAFLDSVGMLEGLSARQLDAISDSSTSQFFDVGEVPSRRGRETSCVFFVKSGELRVVAGSGEGAQAEGGLLGPGSCVCERVLLSGEPFSITTEVTRRCELIRVNLAILRQVLGSELSPIRLQQGFLQAVMQRSGRFASLSQSQLLAAARAMELQEFAPGAQLPDRMGFFVVLDRSVQVGAGGSREVLRRGHWHGAPAAPDAAKAPSPERHVDLYAGHRGCRLAVLAAVRPRASDVDPERALAAMARVLCKVCVFRHLPRGQIELLSRGASRRIYQRGEKVVWQGEKSSHFFVVAAGEACSTVGGHVVRKLVKHAYFGERSIMFDEPHAATIQVTSAEAEMYAIERDTFLKVVREKTQTAEQLIYRAWLQDHGIGLTDLRRLGVIGCGTSGVVHLVRHQSSGFRYALKRVEKVDGKVPRQVRREIEVIAENDHPFIMHMVKTMETPKSVYLLTEYISGGELHAAIRTVSGTLSRSQAMFYTGLMLLMLETLNDRNIVYRDLKPENVMLDTEGYLKLIDFGSARKLDDSCPRTFTMVGTPHYMAPEVMRGKGYGTEVDAWALGVVLYELVCGCLPFGDSLESTPDVCKAVLAGALEMPEDLHESTKSLIAGLLVAKPQKRLGCGPRGYDDVKAAPFFAGDGAGLAGASVAEAAGGAAAGGGRGAGTDYFEMLLRREVQAPIPPSLQVLSDLGRCEDQLSEVQEVCDEEEEPPGGAPAAEPKDLRPEAGGPTREEGEPAADAEPEEEGDPEEPDAPVVCRGPDGEPRGGGARGPPPQSRAPQKDPPPSPPLPPRASS